MHEIEPFYNWEKYYVSANDHKSPFYGKEYNYELYTNEIYGYYIHPGWDYIGSETLYIKILYADYKIKFCVIEMIGEWNDTLYNDVMHLKRNVIDELIARGITKFVLIGESVFNFHGSDDCYYEEWFEDIEEGWIVAINFRDFVHHEWRKFGIDCYINYGGNLEAMNWRTMPPQIFYKQLSDAIANRLNL